MHAVCVCVRVVCAVAGTVGLDRVRACDSHACGRSVVPSGMRSVIKGEAAETLREHERLNVTGRRGHQDGTKLRSTAAGTVTASSYVTWLGS